MKLLCPSPWATKWATAFQRPDARIPRGWRSESPVYSGKSLPQTATRNLRRLLLLDLVPSRSIPVRRLALRADFRRLISPRRPLPLAAGAGVSLRQNLWHGCDCIPTTNTCQPLCVTILCGNRFQNLSAPTSISEGDIDRSDLAGDPSYAPRLLFSFLTAGH